MRRRYESELQDYLDARSPQDAFLEFKRYRLAKSISKKRIARPLPDAHSPKRPFTSFMLFCSDVNEGKSPEISDAVQGVSEVVERARILGQAWKNLDASKKEVCEILSKKRLKHAGVSEKGTRRDPGISSCCRRIPNQRIGRDHQKSGRN